MMSIAYMNTTTRTETPDNYIERNDYCGEPGPPNPEDLCPVCDKLDCICEGDDLQ